MERFAADEAETKAVGASLASELQPGELVLLHGDLGAGKTTLVRGILEGLGWHGAVRSPTFSLLHLYPTQPPLAHADLYRVTSAEGIGLEEVLDAREPRELRVGAEGVRRREQWSLLQDWGLSQARVGLELEGVKPAARAALQAALPNATFLDCSNLLRLIRAVKSQEEIRRISRATTIAEEAAQASLGAAAPGRRLPELVAAFRAGLGQQGADFDHFIFGVHGLGVGEFSNYRLQASDALLVDYGCRFQHYVSDSGLTLALGDLAPPLAERYAALYDALHAGAAQLRPGVPASAARGAMKTRLTEHGITSCYAHGHGFGLDVRDYPIIVDDTDLEHSGVWAAQQMLEGRATSGAVG